MQKHPPILLYSMIVGTVLGIVVYRLFLPASPAGARHVGLKRFEKPDAVKRTPSPTAFKPPEVIGVNSGEAINIPEWESPDLVPIEPPESPPIEPPAENQPASEPRRPRPDPGPRVVPQSDFASVNPIVEAEEPPLETAEEGVGDKKEDELGRLSRQFLTLLIAEKAKAIGKKPVRYVAPWVKTEISPDHQSAVVYFDGLGKAPDCDVHLQFDSVRKKWRVNYVRGGGFGSFTPPLH